MNTKRRFRVNSSNSANPGCASLFVDNLDTCRHLIGIGWDIFSEGGYEQYLVGEFGDLLDVSGFKHDDPRAPYLHGWVYTFEPSDSVSRHGQYYSHVNVEIEYDIEYDLDSKNFRRFVTAHVEHVAAYRNQSKGLCRTYQWDTKIFRNFPARRWACKALAMWLDEVITAANADAMRARRARLEERERERA